MTEPTIPHRPARILVVDDEENDRRLVEMMLKTADYDVRTAPDGVEALKAMEDYRPDLVLLDLRMPQMDGFEIAREIKRNPHTKSIPIVILSALDDRSSRMHGLVAGAEEFLSKPVERAELLVRVRNLLRMKAYSDLLASQNRILEDRVRDRTAQWRDSYRETVHAVSAAIEFQDLGADVHIRRMSLYTTDLAKQLGLGGEYADTIYHASAMHDIGKIGIPREILLKPGTLSASEWDIMRTHTVLGERLLQNGHTPYLRMAADIAAAHHEHWNGSGYPRGLRGESIPLSARITMVCDRYDALRSIRPHKPALTHVETVEILTCGDKRSQPEHFDPVVLAAFAKSHESFETIYRKTSDLPPLSP
jgi:putative two-component system response regulator